MHRMIEVRFLLLHVQVSVNFSLWQHCFFHLFATRVLLLLLIRCHAHRTFFWSRLIASLVLVRRVGQQVLPADWRLGREFFRLRRPAGRLRPRWVFICTFSSGDATSDACRKHQGARRPWRARRHCPAPQGERLARPDRPWHRQPHSHKETWQRGTKIP